MTAGARVGLALVGLMLVAAGALTAWMTRRIGALGRASATWRETSGEIEASAATGTWMRLGSARVMSWSPGVRYRYVVDGNAHAGWRVGFGDHLGGPGDAGRARAEDTCARFPVGARVPVFYDPARPEEATLMRAAGGSAAAVTGLVVAVMMALGGVGCVLFAFRR